MTILVAYSLWLYLLSKKHIKIVSINAGNVLTLVTQQNVALIDTRMR